MFVIRVLKGWILKWLVILIKKCNNNVLLILYSMEIRYFDDDNYFIYRVFDIEFKIELLFLFLLIYIYNFKKIIIE